MRVCRGKREVRMGDEPGVKKAPIVGSPARGNKRLASRPIREAIERLGLRVARARIYDRGQKKDGGERDVAGSASGGR